MTESFFVSAHKLVMTMTLDDDYDDDDLDDMTFMMMMTMIKVMTW